MSVPATKSEEKSNEKEVEIKTESKVLVPTTVPSKSGKPPGKGGGNSRSRGKNPGKQTSDSFTHSKKQNQTESKAGIALDPLTGLHQTFTDMFSNKPLPEMFEDAKGCVDYRYYEQATAALYNRIVDRRNDASQFISREEYVRVEMLREQGRLQKINKDLGLFYPTTEYQVHLPEFLPVPAPLWNALACLGEYKCEHSRIRWIPLCAYPDEAFNDPKENPVPLVYQYPWQKRWLDVLEAQNQRLTVKGKQFRIIDGVKVLEDKTSIRTNVRDDPKTIANRERLAYLTDEVTKRDLTDEEIEFMDKMLEFEGPDAQYLTSKANAKGYYDEETEDDRNFVTYDAKDHVPVSMKKGSFYGWNSELFEAYNRFYQFTKDLVQWEPGTPHSIEGNEAWIMQVSSLGNKKTVYTDNSHSLIPFAHVASIFRFGNFTPSLAKRFHIPMISTNSPANDWNSAIDGLMYKHIPP